MIFFLKNTSYQEFDAWLCNKAGKHGFLVSYDAAGLIDDLGDITQVPKKNYPLRIYLSKINKNGIANDSDGFFFIEKVGINLQVCPKAYNQKGLDNLRPVIEEIKSAWPDNRPPIEEGGKLSEHPKKPGRRHEPDDIWAYNEIHKTGREPSEVYKEWLKMPGVEKRNLKDPLRQFRKIVKWTD